MTEFVAWTAEEDQKLFQLYKEQGTQWSAIAKLIGNKTSNQTKNRFYSTLRRVAIKRREEIGGPPLSSSLSKGFLLQYVEDAIAFGHSCASKRGRKKKRQQPMVELPRISQPELYHVGCPVARVTPVRVPCRMVTEPAVPHFNFFYAPQPDILSLSTYSMQMLGGDLSAQLAANYAPATSYLNSFPMVGINV